MGRPRKPRPAMPLEYRLVDMMSEAADDPVVMQSISTIIVYLKTRQRPRQQVFDSDEMVREGMPPP